MQGAFAPSQRFSFVRNGDMANRTRLVSFEHACVARVDLFAAVLSTRSFALLLILVFALSSPAAGQDPYGSAQPVLSAQPVVMKPDAGNPSSGDGEANKEEADAEKKDEGSDEKKDESKDEEKESDTIERPKTPPRVPDPREFEVALDDRGRVPAFSFVGQGWPDVLQWLANLSNLSLDWQQLPNDYVNLTTDRSHTLAETRDLINRLLHARGYTMLHADGVLSVFKLDKLDPSLIPRVTEEQLYDSPPHDVVKVSFQLSEGMEVDKTAEDVKQLLSAEAKLMPLVATRRIMAIDVVANLRLVSALLNDERAEAEGHLIPREFVLQHARPEQVIDALYVILGMDPQSKPSQMEMQLQQQKLQIMMKMQESGKDVGKMLQKDGPPVFLAYNRHRNSVLANAPPAQMRIIERSIEYLDTPVGGELPVASATQGRKYLQKYELVTMDPQALQLMLEEIGNLDPRAELRADSETKILFARAFEADHQKISGMIDQLDGAGRQLEVIPLRYRRADAVAGSIYNLMIGEKKKEDSGRRRYYFFGYGRNNDDEEDDDGFRVDADIESNRLLLWATEIEMKKVRAFLVKLGELPGEEGDPRTVRIRETLDPATTARLLQRLQRSWSAVGENELMIDVPPPRREDDEQESDQPSDPPPGEDRSARRRPAAQTRFAQLHGTSSTDSATPDDDAKPPISIIVTDDGRLVYSSSDTRALDQLEQLLNELAPPAPRFKVFRLTNVSAYSVWWNLDEYFHDEIHGQDGEPILDWYGYVQRTTKDEGRMRLSRRRKLKIIYDTPSNTILVANASPSQLYEVEQLINEYDRPASADSVKSRRTEPVKIRYSRAKTIAAALKEVYRDLLSSKDKEFDSGEGKQGAGPKESVTIIRYRSSSGDDGSKKTAPLKVGFEGALSIGVDEVANMLIVSAHEAIFDSVIEMIQQLDEEARPKTTVQVHRVNGRVRADSLQKALAEALGNPWPGGKPEKAADKDAGEEAKQEAAEKVETKK